jgi:hypothetical protein
MLGPVRGVGFEPTVPFQVRRRVKPVPSTRLGQPAIYGGFLSIPK